LLLNFKVLLELLFFFYLAPYRIHVCSTNALLIATHCHARTLFLFTYAKIGYVSVHTYPSKNRIRTLRILEPCWQPAPWQTCHDAALFSNYFAQTCWEVETDVKND